MKKLFLAVLLAFSMTILLYAEGGGGELGGDLRMGYSFPFLGNMLNTFSVNSGGEAAALMLGQALLSVAFSSISIGGGVHYTIIPHILAPGLYADLHFNFISWFFTKMFTNIDFIMLQTGLRLYNHFSFATASFEPFFGFNFTYINVEKILLPIPLMAAGAVFNVDRFGLEYSYNFLPIRIDGGRLPGIHRISFVSSLMP